MLKAKRIAIGGWLNNALSIMTRGWFGGAAVDIPGCTVVSDTLLNTLTLSDSLLNTVTLSTAAASITLSTALVGSVTLSNSARNTITLSDEVCL